MKSGICPKCSAQNVRKVNNWFPGHSDVLRISFVWGVRLTNYVCGECGYHESYVEIPQELQTVVERGELVPAAKK